MSTSTEKSLQQSAYESITVVGVSDLASPSDVRVDEDDETEEGVAKRISSAKESLIARLGEIERRVDKAKGMAKNVVDLKHWIKNPWIPLGAGVVAGYMFGRGGDKRSHVSPAVGGAVTAIAGAVLKQILQDVISKDSKQ